MADAVDNRLSKNRAIAQRFYDAYHHSVERGELTGAFAPDDDAKVVRFEFYDDWHGFPQALAFAYDLPLDEVTHTEHYGAAPWTPAPVAAMSSPLPANGERPPRNEAVVRNLATAELFFEQRRVGAPDGGLQRLDEHGCFAAEWTFFSPWTGEVPQAAAAGLAAIADRALGQARTALTDFGVDVFDAWPTDDGCAWRWRVGGQDPAGIRYEYWEQVFIESDDAGRITRLEVYDDWQGFPQAIGRITGLTVEQLWDPAPYLASGSTSVPAGP